MEVICPNCQKKLNLQEQVGGQQVSCPMCQGKFQAPTLPTIPSLPTMPPLAPQPPGIAARSMPAPSPAPELYAETVHSEVSDLAYEPAPVAADAPAQECICTLKPSVIVWIAPVSLTLLLIFSFFAWIQADFNLGRDLTLKAMLWQSGWEYVLFGVLAIGLAWPLSILALAVSLGVVRLPDPSLRKWIPVLCLGLILVPWAILAGHYASAQFQSINFTGLGMKLGLRVAFLAMVGLALDAWLVRRAEANLPWPQVTLRW